MSQSDLFNLSGDGPKRATRHRVRPFRPTAFYAKIGLHLPGNQV